MSSIVADYVTQAQYSNIAYSPYKKTNPTQLNNKSIFHFPDMSTLENGIYRLLNKIYEFLCLYKIWIIAILATLVVIGIIVLIAYIYFKLQPEYPNVLTKSSLNSSKISIEYPLKTTTFPHFTFLFCVDTSSSMKNQRENNLKAGLKNIVNSALNFTQKIPGSEIQIGIVEFNTTAQTIHPLTVISQENIQDINQSIENYQSNGENTNIIAGLEKSLEELENIASNKFNATRTLVLLTDGLNNVTVDSTTEKKVHKMFSKIQPQFFGIGIHLDNDNTMLKTISCDFKGEYINTTSDQDIANVVSNIYEKTIADFSDIALISYQLEPGAWSIDNFDSENSTEGKSKIFLGNLLSGNTLTKKIHINTHKLDTCLDLSLVSFKLCFKDPEKKPGSLILPWNPNSIIDPEICNI